LPDFTNTVEPYYCLQVYLLTTSMLRVSSSKLSRVAHRVSVSTQSQCLSVINPVTNARTDTTGINNTHIWFNSNYFSTKTSSASESKASSCPFSQARELSSEAAATLGINSTSSAVTNNDFEQITLKETPALPIIGSFFQLIPFVGKHISKHYGVPTMEEDNAYEFYSELNRNFGDFYTLTIPGMGAVYILNDPAEMMKVLRSEGSYPRGGISVLTPFIKWAKSRNMNISKGHDNGFFGQGETWRTFRTFLQSDLLSPQAAKGYVPGVIEAAEVASKGASHYSDDLNNYLNLCAFDMFQTIMFGEFTKIADPNTPTDPVNEEFVTNSVLSLNLMVRHITDKSEVLKASIGYTTPSYTKFEGAMDIVNKIANQKILAFKEKWERGELNENEKASYFARAFERQKQEGTVSVKEMMEISMISLNAGVDTTSSFICWALVHLSLNPSVQQQLYDELKQNVDETDGKLSADALTKKKSPYLHAVLRESHRATPVHPTTMTKSNSSKEIEIHGITMPKGTVFSFETYSLGVNPEIVENPEEFRPERWTPEAEQARKGTRAEVLDHQFYKDPFSQGARRCPGSRIAVNETLVLLSQLVLDWKIEAPSNVTSLKDIEYEQQTLLVPKLPKMKFTPR